MDLLGGYDSDDSSASGTAVDPPTVAPTVAPSTGLAKAAAVQPKKTSKRGRRLLKLQAVLPQHIWNQLTQSNNKASGDNEDDDDDDDNSNEGDENRPKGNRSIPPKRNNHGSAMGGPPQSDLISLLSALPKTKSKAPKASSSSILGSAREMPPVTKDDEEEDEHDEEAPASAPAAAPDGLGAAFLTSTVEITRRKKTSSSTVRSIHPAPAAPTDPPTSPTPPLATAPTSTATVAPPRPQVYATTSGLAPRQRTAAPMVRRTPVHLPPPAPKAYGAYPEVAYQQQAPAPPPAPAPTTGKHSRKRRMEALLRSGQLDQVSSDLQLEGTVVHPEYLQAQPQQAVPGEHSHHGVRVVPTAHYNVSTGTMTASTNLSGKQRGKNQLSALLANAASLEARRAEEATMRPSGTQKIHRANAKRKYGW